MQFPLASTAVVVSLGAALIHAQVTTTCGLTGIVSAGRMALPGVVVSLTQTGESADVVDVSSSSLDGTFTLKAAPGGYKLRAEMTGFAPVLRDLVIEEGCRAQPGAQPISVQMTLASRSDRSATGGSPAPASGSPAQTGLRARSTAGASAPANGGDRSAAGARAARARSQSSGTPSSFRSLELLADQNGARPDEAGGDSSAAQLLLPPGFSTEAATEAVATVGAQAASAFGAGGPGGFGNPFGGDGVPFGGAGGPGGRGGGPGGAGGPGGPGVFGQRGGPGGFGGFGRGRQGNQIRGSLSDTLDTSALDAAPYSLNGQPTPKPDYLQQRLTATIGGPLTIPKLVDSPRTFFFANYNGNHSRNPYDAYSTVPTLAERGGDLSAFGRPILDPVTHLPFSDGQIPASSLDPVAQRLLSLFPPPNQPGDRQNYHLVTTSISDMDDVNVRIVRSFGTPTERQGPQGGRGAFGAGGFGGGGRGGGGGTANLNIAIHYRHSSSTSTNPFPTLGGSTDLGAWDIPASFSFTKGGALNTIRFGFNRRRTDALNAYAFTRDVAGQAGVLGVSTDPFDWGAPDLSLSTFASVHDITPSTRTDRTLSFGDSLVKTRGTHTFRLGGDYRDLMTDSRTDRNARGSFVFSGLYTGVDFGDFLLGLPQQSLVQYGPGLEQFHSRSWDLYAQDDWRVNAKLTVNAGARYEYLAPYTEAGNRLVTLDVAPGFTAAVPVAAGGTGPYSGPLPDALVRPFRGGFAPRTGIAWRAAADTIIRAGYGLNYSTSVYQSMAQQLAGQPPYAVANTVLAALGSPTLLATALVEISPTATLNTYAVDPNYRAPMVQIWNAGVQRDLSRIVTMDVTYTGTKGMHLDLVRAPNRNPDGSIRIDGVAPFLWESSDADSISNSVTLRIRRRMSNGLGTSASYTLSKSTDDASSIGGTAVVVAQNDQNLAAEWGLSSFDQRHRFAADATYELPFGEDRRWLKGGTGAALLGHWQLNATLQLASGTPYTARVLGAVHDVATGVNGTLRADYSGGPIEVADPTTQAFFNKGVFSVPPPGTFGTAARNTIIGPGVSVLNFGLMRSVEVGQTRSLTFQIQAINALNTVQYATIDTVVNSPTFGQVTSVRPMRRFQIAVRFRF